MAGLDPAIQKSALSEVIWMACMKCGHDMSTPFEQMETAKPNTAPLARTSAQKKA